MKPTDRQGRKYDNGKPRWDLLPFNELEEVVKVLTEGAKKYDDDNWKHVPQARQRYFAAAMRHMKTWWTGGRNDPEDDLHLLAHAVCDLLFLMWFDNQPTEG